MVLIELEIYTLARPHPVLSLGLIERIKGVSPSDSDHLSCLLLVGIGRLETFPPRASQTQTHLMHFKELNDEFCIIDDFLKSVNGAALRCPCIALRHARNVPNSRIAQYLLDRRLNRRPT